VNGLSEAIGGGVAGRTWWRFVGNGRLGNVTSKIRRCREIGVDAYEKTVTDGENFWCVKDLAS